jgi:hypothetical protein
LFGANNLSDADPSHATSAARRAAELDLGDAAADLLRSRLQAVAEATVRAIVVEVPSYANALAGRWGQDSVPFSRLGGSSASSAAG